MGPLASMALRRMPQHVKDAGKVTLAWLLNNETIAASIYQSVQDQIGRRHPNDDNDVGYWQAMNEAVRPIFMSMLYQAGYEPQITDAKTSKLAIKFVDKIVDDPEFQADTMSYAREKLRRDHNDAVPDDGEWFAAISERGHDLFRQIAAFYEGPGEDK